MAAPARFAEAITMHFAACQDCYGDINISLQVFVDYVWDIACRQLKNSADESAAIDLTTKLYLRDLYLTCGCVNKSEKAWKVFDLRYRRFIADLVRFCYRHGTDSEEIADLVLVSLYFQDRSGQQRIGSYDGRSSLTTWLRVIVINRAINEQNDRKAVDEENIADIPDVRALANFESTLRAQRYGKIVSDALAQALGQVTETERLMLFWRYEENMPLGEMAGLLGIHQSNVTRRLLRLQHRLRESVIQTLSSQNKLSSSAIQECLADVVDNPLIAVSLVSLIEGTPKPVSGAPDTPLSISRLDDFPRAANGR